MKKLFSTKNAIALSAIAYCSLTPAFAIDPTAVDPAKTEILSSIAIIAIIGGAKLSVLGARKAWNMAMLAMG